jgi:hypothetical protein
MNEKSGKEIDILKKNKAEMLKMRSSSSQTKIKLKTSTTN